MNKMNKKGFTLIEMLVVIAIIAILVAIIIPAVSSSTQRAAAATDAANLRSAKAVISIGILDGKYSSNESSIPADACGVPAVGKYNKGDFNASVTAGVVSVSYGENTIEALADIADDGVANGTNGAPGTSVGDGHTHVKVEGSNLCGVSGCGATWSEETVTTECDCTTSNTMYPGTKCSCNSYWNHGHQGGNGACSAKKTATETVWSK